MNISIYTSKKTYLEVKYLNIEVGEHYKGKDCHGDLIAGTITKVLEKTFIVSIGCCK